MLYLIFSGIGEFSQHFTTWILTFILFLRFKYSEPFPNFKLPLSINFKNIRINMIPIYHLKLCNIYGRKSVFLNHKCLKMLSIQSKTKSSSHDSEFSAIWPSIFNFSKSRSHTQQLFDCMPFDTDLPSLRYICNVHALNILSEWTTCSLDLVYFLNNNALFDSEPMWIINQLWTLRSFAQPIIIFVLS